VFEGMLKPLPAITLRISLEEIKYAQTNLAGARLSLIHLIIVRLLKEPRFKRMPEIVVIRTG
jgi:hypothetical protein